MDLEKIEAKFKDITGVALIEDLSVYPLTHHVGFDVRDSEKKEHGEVFTPLQIVDRMLETSNAKGTEMNMDLCAGRGQFTIRMLRKFVNEDPNFDIEKYLKNKHWFNEYNPASALELIEIFGEDINLAIGDARKLKFMVDDVNTGNWMQGIYWFNGDFWEPVSKEQIAKFVKDPDALKSKANALF